MEDIEQIKSRTRTFRAAAELIERLRAERDALVKDAARYRVARSDPYGIACLERNPRTGDRVILFGIDADAALQERQP